MLSNWISLATMKNQDLKPLTHYLIEDEIQIRSLEEFKYFISLWNRLSLEKGHSSVILNLITWKNLKICYNSKGTFSTTIAFMLRFFVKSVSGWKLLNNATKSSNLAVAMVLDTSLCIFFRKPSNVTIWCNLFHNLFQYV